MRVTKCHITGIEGKSEHEFIFRYQMWAKEMLKRQRELRNELDAAKRARLEVMGLKNKVMSLKAQLLTEKIEL